MWKVEARAEKKELVDRIKRIFRKVAEKRGLAYDELPDGAVLWWPTREAYKFAAWLHYKVSKEIKVEASHVRPRVAKSAPEAASSQPQT